MTREEERMAVLDRLLSEALELRETYDSIRKRRDARDRAQALVRLRDDILEWVDAGKRSLGAYPEIAAILEFRRSREDLVGELDSCLGGLLELKRLTRLSQVLGLPI